MSLKTVILDADVYAVCLQHALITQREEIMGLLIGEIDEEKCISRISASIVLIRIDKRPDRVEISPEQLIKGTQYAEMLQEKLNRPMRVIGWYHSHPGLPVYPSDIDLKTQATYQLMEPNYAGLIFSVFRNPARPSINEIALTCFQTHRDKKEQMQRKEVQLVIRGVPLGIVELNGLINLPRVLIQEEEEAYNAEENVYEEELCYLHNNSFKALSLVYNVSKVLRPLCDGLMERLDSTHARISTLQKLKAELQTHCF